MKFLSSSPLLLLIFLLCMSISLHADDIIRQCFVCTEKSSPKCKGNLSPSDTELIKDCPPGIGSKAIPKGCQMIVKQTKEFVYPKKELVWRDCMYASDLEVHGRTFSFPSDPNETYASMTAGGAGDQYTGYEVEYSVPKMNNLRGQLQLPLLPEYDMSIPDGMNWLQVYYHPNRGWKLSNGKNINTLSFGFIKPTYTRNVKCYVCTDADEGCQDKLTSANSKFAKNCVGSPDTTVPVGCQTLIGQYEYPGKTYFYRDCLYEHYIKCHLKNYRKVSDGHVFRLREWITCLNSVRSYLGLSSHSIDRLPNEDSRPVTVLSYKSFETVRGQGQVIKRRGLPDLSNGEAIIDLKSQPTPPEIKIDGPFNCFTCDTRQVLADQYDCDNLPNSGRSFPSQLCNSPSDDAYGCLMLYEEDKYTGKTSWLRRECWFKGDLFCLKGLPMSPTGRSEDCTNPKPGGCNARELIKEGKRVFWNGRREFRSEEDFEDFQNCVRNIRVDQKVNDTLPELPGFYESNEYGAPKVFHYSFCAGEGECNVKGSPNFVPLPRPTDPTATPSPPTGTGGDPCQPHEDFNDASCEWENGDRSRSDEWIVYVGVLILIIIGCAIGIGACLWYRKNQRHRNQGAFQQFPYQQQYANQSPSRSAPNSPGLDQQSAAHLLNGRQ